MQRLNSYNFKPLSEKFIITYNCRMNNVLDYQFIITITFIFHGNQHKKLSISN